MTRATHIAGHLVARATIRIPEVGPWWADVALADDPDLSGQVTLVAGELELVGTIDPARSGDFGAQRLLRIVAGGGGWGKLLAARAYHSDSRILARTVVEDAAREAGETLGTTFSPAAEAFAIDYVRPSGPASRALEDAIGARAWWVAYDGTTNVGTRPTSEADPRAYEVIEHRPDEAIVVLAVDDPTAIGIGTIISERLDAPQTAREIEIELTTDSFLVKVWCGGAAGARGRVAGALQRIVRHVGRERLFGLWPYQVVRMTGEATDRVDLRPVEESADDGLPELGAISMMPGVSGAHGRLQAGQRVLVQFVGGRRTKPVITHFAGRDGVGWAPHTLTMHGQSQIKAGDAATKKLGFADDVRGELAKIATTLGSATAPAGGGSVTYGTPYTAPLSGDAIGTTKLVAE